MRARGSRSGRPRSSAAHDAPSGGAAPSDPEREERTEELFEARRGVVVGRVAQRDADVLELALDVIERGQVAGAVELGRRDNTKSA